MQSPYTDFTNFILNLFQPLYDFFNPLGIPFGPMAWFVIIVTTPLVVIIIALVIRGRRAGGGSSANVTEAIQKVIASTGDVSGGMAGAKKLKYLKKPAEALVFLKVEENAIQQAISAIDYYAQQGEIDEATTSSLRPIRYDSKLYVERSQRMKSSKRSLQSMRVLIELVLII